MAEVYSPVALFAEDHPFGEENKSNTGAWGFYDFAHGIKIYPYALHSIGFNV